jgi:putative ABC transport system permease protein
VRLWHITSKEMWRRKTDLVASLAAVAIGIAVAVAVRTVAASMEEAVTSQVHELGANLLVLPASSEVSNYYTADFGGATLPEDYAHALNRSRLSDKVHDMAAKLSGRIRIAGEDAVLTGVLPKSELEKPRKFRSSPAGLTLPGRRAPEDPGPPREGDESLPFVTFDEIKTAKKRMTVEELGLFDVLLGSEVARRLDKAEGDDIRLFDKTFMVSGILEETGTVDDIRIYGHLHTVQRLLGKGRVITMIEVVGCGCHVDVQKLGREVEDLLPGTRAVTIRHIARVQDEMIALGARLSAGLLVLIVIVAGVVVANHMVTNVEERRTELASLIAVGATPATILRLLLGKAVLLGLLGGGLGFVIGSALAVWAGPRLAEVSVTLDFSLAVPAVLFSAALCTLFALLPAFAAAKTDPARALQE